VSQTVEQSDRHWQEWCRRFDIVYRDVLTLFHDRHVWKNLIAMLEQNSTLSDTATVENWIIRTYVDRQCSAIRRLNDDRTAIISFRQCLTDLINDPTLVTRSRYEELATAEADARGIEEIVRRGRGLAGYAGFADISGDHLRKSSLKKDRVTLKQATASVKTYTDEHIAHRSHSANLSTLTFGDLDSAIDAVGDLARKYYRLRHPGQTLWLITPTVEPRWLAAFQHPWWTANFQPIREADLG
jgi:hypothetical protein